MKKSIFPFLLLLIIPICLFSQNTVGKIEYKENLSLGVPVVRYWSLFFDKSNSLYIEDKTKTKKENNIKTNDYMIIKSDITDFYIASLEKNELLSQKKVAVKPYIVREEIPQIKWTLFEESKKIGNFTCQKAQGNFRGRSYIAWFTSEIPINLAPWKLNGLPGAILEFYDTTRQIYSIAVNIELNNKININDEIEKAIFKGDTIEIEKYVYLKADENAKMLKYVLSKYGRNAKISKVEPTKRQGFELIYEWEEN